MTLLKDISNKNVSCPAGSNRIKWRGRFGVWTESIIFIDVVYSIVCRYVYLSSIHIKLLGNHFEEK